MENKSNVVAFELKGGANPAANTIQQINKVAGLYAAQENIQSVTNLKNELMQRRLNTVNEQDLDILDKRLELVTVEKIRRMSSAQINDMYKDEDGNIIEFNIEADADRINELRRDFLIYLKTSAEAFKSIDAQMEGYQKIMDESEDELKEIQNKFGDINEFIQNHVREEYESTEDPEKKAKLGTIIEGYGFALNLENVIEHYKKFNARNTISDYKSQPVKMYGRYEKVIKQLDLRTDMTRYNNIEHRFLEEKYQAYPNLFVFAVMKMIAYSKDPKKEREGLFISQLGVNLRSLYAGTLSEESKQILLDGIRKVLDLFI